MTLSSTHASAESATAGVDAVRKAAAGGSLVGFAVAGLLSAVIGSDEGTSTSPADLYAIAEGDNRALLASAAVFVVSSVLMVPAAGGMLHLLRGRGAITGHLGAVFFVLGAFGHLGYATWQLMLVAVPYEPDRAAMVAFLDRSSLVTDALLPLLLSVVLGTVLLVVALWRAGRLPVWILGVTAAAVVFSMAAETLGWQGKAVAIVNWTAMGLVFCFLGVRVLRMTQEEWRSAGGHG